MRLRYFSNPRKTILCGAQLPSQIVFTLHLPVSPSRCFHSSHVSRRTGNATADRSYTDAVNALNSLQSNYSIVEELRKKGAMRNAGALEEMRGWCRKGTDYEPEDFNRLNVIHIAGTKGKGSTSAFISQILTQYLGSRTKSGKILSKIGLYTSPHLRSVRERIQINNEPLSEEAFAKYFFEVWDNLEASARAAVPPEDVRSKPIYFRFLTMLAFHVYMREGVDTVVLECGIGGEYDSTNVVVKPSVTGITSLGIDHTAILGNTIEEIAWHKAGIMKESVPAFTAPQPSSAFKVLQARAEERRTSIAVVERHPDLDTGKVKLGLAADFQKTNASLAVAVAAQHLEQLGIEEKSLPTLDTWGTLPLPARFQTGLGQAQWGGRCETRHEGRITWYIDGGHTIESIRLAAEWFASQLSPISRSSATPAKRILLFNQQTRDATALARALHDGIASSLSTVTSATDTSDSPNTRLFDHAVFSTNVTYGAARGGYKPDLVSINVKAADVEALSVQNSLAAAWHDIDAGSQTSVQPTIEDAVEQIRRIAGEAEGQDVVVLVTGSLHLVGGFLEVLDADKVR